MDWLFNVLTFAAQTFVIVIAIVIILITFFGLIAKVKEKRELEIKSLNDHYKDLTERIRENILTKKELKKAAKAEAKKQKKQKPEDIKANVFVVDFVGDLKASATEALREELTAILGVAAPQDEVVVRIDSTGGMVHAYGLAASQLTRVTAAQIPLTVCVDKVAASGGYLMACVANKLLAAPFAIVGSIGVLAPVPNVHKLLKKHDIDYHEMTAGEYKRTMSIFGEITENGKAKFVEQLEDTHKLFKEFVAQHRQQLDLTKVATGEYWYGEQAITLGLVDKLQTSDDYLCERAKTAKIYQVTYHAPKKLTEKLSELMKHGVTNILHTLIHRLNSRI